MYPVKNIASGKNEDLTPKFKEQLSQIIKACEEAKILAEQICPYAAESKIFEIQTHLRQTVQTITTVSNHFQYAVPETPWKKEHIEQCWAGESSSTKDIEAKKGKSNTPKESFDAAIKDFFKETGKIVYNCCPGYDSAGDFALWLIKRTGYEQSSETQT